MAAQAESYKWFVGVDWATQPHQICVVDADGRLVAERAVAHAGDAIGEWIEWLVQRTGHDPERVAVAIEIPRGALVETLVERGFHVYALALLSLSVLSPSPARAQPAGKIPKIGYLSNSAGHSVPDSAFLQGLRDLGYIEGGNIVIEARYSSGKSDRFPDFAAELTRLARFMREG